MDNQATAIVCPNCGATTTNHHNCEYCGSLLVRYTAENKQINKDVFSGESTVIPGLKEELKKNLSYQKIKKGDEVVLTTITDSNGLMFQVIETAHCNFGTSSSNPFEGHYDKGVTLRLTFETRDEDSDYAALEQSRLNWFKQQEFYFLFTQQNLPMGVYYYIDFGEDVENAAKLISSVALVGYDEDDDDIAFSFETRMVTSKNVKNEGGILVDTTKKKAAIYGIAVAVIYIIVRILYYIII